LIATSQRKKGTDYVRAQKNDWEFKM